MLSKRSCDVVVMGGGVMGSSIAYHLSLMGCKNVTVVEKDPCYKHASAMLSVSAPFFVSNEYLRCRPLLHFISHILVVVQAGGIRQQFSVRENIQMSKYGVEFLKNPSKLYVPSDSNKDAPDFQLRENGYLFVSSTKEGLQLLKENNRTQKDAGVTWTHMMDQAALAAKFPWLKVSDLTGGTYGSENEGYFDPWSLLAALKAKVGCA
jgi:glycine/D-amino acid oxidase-like deaminating enzyme